MSRENISDKTIDEILEQIQKPSAESKPQVSDSDVNSILAELGIEDTSNERPHIQFASRESVAAALHGQKPPVDTPTMIQPTAQMGRFVPADSIVPPAPVISDVKRKEQNQTADAQPQAQQEQTQPPRKQPVFGPQSLQQQMQKQQQAAEQAAMLKQQQAAQAAAMLKQQQAAQAAAMQKQQQAAQAAAMLKQQQAAQAAAMLKQQQAAQAAAMQQQQQAAQAAAMQKQQQAAPVANEQKQPQQPVGKPNIQIINIPHQETSTLELPTIKAYTNAQEQREEEIKQKAAREALLRAGVNPEPYAPAPEPYNAGQYQPQTPPAALRKDFTPPVPGAKTAPEQIGNAMFGEVDDRFKDFFGNTVAQDSREAEQQAYIDQKQRKKSRGFTRLLKGFFTEVDETYLTEEFTAPIEKGYDTISVEVTQEIDGVETNTDNQPDKKIKTYTIKGVSPDDVPEKSRKNIDFQPKSKSGIPDIAYLNNTDYLAASTNEYNHVKDAPAVAAILKNMRVTRVLRMVVTGIITVVLLYFGFSSRVGGLPAFAAFDPHTAPFAYLTVNFILLSIAILTCITTLATGIVGFFKRPTSDTFVAIAAISALVQNIVYMFQADGYDPEAITIFAPVVTLLLFTNTLGKWLQSKVVSSNFEVASAEHRHSAAFMVKSEDLARKLCQGIGEPMPNLLLSRTADLVKRFLHQSFSQHKSDENSKKYSFIMLAAALLCGIICGLRTQNVFTGISAFAAALCVAAPLASTLVYALPALFLQQEASNVGAVIPGPSAITELGETNVVLLNGRDLFPTSCVRMRGIKTFEKSRIDLAMLYGASLINSCCDTLRAPFMSLVDNKESSLYKVENVQTETGLGYVAWIDGKRIIMGNRTMMQRHSIEVPSDEYEQKYTNNGQSSPVYIAVSGKLYGVFLVSYAPDAAAQDALNELGDAGINAILQTDDFNITSALVRSTYNLSKTTVKVLSQSEQSLLASQTAYVHETDGIMIHDGTCASFLGGLHAAARAAANENLSATVQVAAILFSLAMCLVLSFSNGLTGLALLAVVLYHVGWCTLTAVLPILFKHK